MPRPLSIVPALLLTAACGGTVVFDDDASGEGGASPSSTTASGADSPAPLALYVAGRDACGVEAPLSEVEATMSVDASELETLHVVELAFVDECTGAGGQYILARTVDGTREMWLGAHACSFFDASLQDGELRPGVARARQTAALFETPEGACVSFPGEDERLTSDLTVEAIALFATRDDAIAFAAVHD